MKKRAALYLALLILMSSAFAAAECSHVWITLEHKSPTCTDPGLLLKECIYCGAREKVELQPVDHRWDYKEYSASTCEKNGYFHGVCMDCGKEEWGKLPLADHDWHYEKVEASTCIEYGYYHRKCTVCGLSEEGKLPLGAHTWSYKNNILPTCTEPGYFDRTCMVCKLHEEEKPAALGHIPGDWIVTREPTKTRDGERVILCTVCSVLLKIEAIPALGLSNHPAAPAIAAHLLMQSDVAPNYDTGFTDEKGKPVYNNYISQVAAHMGPGTDFDGIAKTEYPQYRNAVRDYLILLGAAL